MAARSHARPRLRIVGTPLKFAPDPGADPYASVRPRRIA